MISQMQTRQKIITWYAFASFMRLTISAPPGDRVIHDVSYESWLRAMERNIAALTGALPGEL